jgi:hypothetical protein
MADKVYLLDPPAKQRDDGTKPRVYVPAGVRTQAAPRIDLEDVPEAWVKAVPQPQVAAAQPGTANRRAFHPTSTLLALYALGGIAPLALRVGPRKFAWAVASALSLAGWATLVWYWPAVRAAMQSGRLPILPALAGLAVVHVVGAVAWTRAVSHVVRDERFKSNTLPRWMRNPWTTGIAGLVVPGVGLAIAGRHVRAALALWNGATVVAAALVLANAGLLWSWNVKSGADALPKSFIESLFIASAVALCTGALAWVATALDGARLAESRRAALRRVREGAAVSRADGITLALVASLVAFAVTLHPAVLARDLDRFATAMRFEGYRMLPLTIESAAARLDPGRPEYAMRVAELHAEMGRPEAARLIHERLRERWEVYAQMLLQTAAATRMPAPAEPLQPTRDLVPRAQEFAPSVAGAPVVSPAAQ